MQKPGCLLYDLPFTWETNTISFSTAFQFQFITSLARAGDGMAFFISPHNTLQNYTMDFFPPSSHHLFAAEFEINNNHTGFEFIISFPHPRASSTHPDLDLDLYANPSFMVWVDYYAATTSIELCMLNINKLYDNDTRYHISAPRFPPQLDS